MRNDLKQFVEFMTKMLDLDLSPDSPRYEIQQQFKKFMSENEEEFQGQFELNTTDLHNNGELVSLVTIDEEYVLLCNMDLGTIEVSKLKDYDECLYDSLETVEFSFPKLRELAKSFVRIQ